MPTDEKFNLLGEKAFARRSPLATSRGTKKSQLAWLQMVLKKLSELSYQDLENFADAFDKVLEQVREREDHESNSFVKIEYKQISDSYYAYLRDWGSNQLYKALGCVYFQPFRKYKLVHKKTKEIKILASLGLWRLEENKLFLLIQYAYPQSVLQQYEFLDFDLVFPAEPKAPQRLLVKHFAKKQWEYYCLGEVDNFDELQIEQDTMTFVNSALVKIPHLKIDIDIPQVKGQNQKVLKKEVYLGTEPITIEVASKHMAGVVEKLRAWQTFSRALTDPGITRLKTSWNKDSNYFILATIQGQELVVLNDSTSTLSVPNPQLLWQLLWQNTVVVSKSTKVKFEHQELAKQLANILQNKQSYNSKEFLNYLLLDNK